MNNITEILNNINYSLDYKYVPSDFALEFINFIKLVNGNRGEENTTPVLHYRVLDQIINNDIKYKNVANMLFRGAAKALALDTQLITPTGFIKIRDIQAGDRVIDRNGQATKVTHVSKIFNNQTYTIELTDGSSFIANEDHIHIVQRRTSVGLGKSGLRENKWIEYELTTKELLDKGVVSNRKINERNPSGTELRWFIPLVNQAVEFESQGSSIDPYTVGVILGDGNVDKHTGMPSISSHIDDVDELRSYIPYEQSSVYHDKRRYETVSFRLTGIGLLVKKVIGVNTAWTKAIPRELLFGSVEDRIAVLRGLMDTDGTISQKGHASFTSISKELVEGVKHIVKSLGGYARITRYENAYAGYYTVAINLLDINPFRLKRKADLWQPNKYYKSGARVGIKSIIPTPQMTESRCIAVDSPTKSFLIEDVIVTHNTALLGEYLFLYLGVYGELPEFGSVPLALYVSDSIENGVKNMRRNLEHRWYESEFLQRYIPEIKFTDIRWEFINRKNESFIVKGYGANTGVRGSKEKAKRPVLAVLDDLLSDEDARSPTVIGKIEDTIYKAIHYALHPSKYKIIWSGTPFNSKDPLYKAIESGAWAINVFPVCEKFPCSKEEFRGAWEDRFNYEAVKEKYDMAVNSGMVNTFNQEMMLRIMSEEERLIQESEILWYKRSTVIQNKERFNFYITTDFATTSKSSGDYSVISVWALNNNGDWLWTDGIVEKQTMDKNINDLFRLVQMYSPQAVGVEISGQQKGFISWIRNEMLNRNVFFSLASDKNSTEVGLRPNLDKMARFQIVLPWFKMNKFFFPEEMKESKQMIEAMDELRLICQSGFKSKHDDFIDTISMLGSMTVWRPSQTGDLSKKDDSGLWEIEQEELENNLSSYIVN